MGHIISSPTFGATRIAIESTNPLIGSVELDLYFRNDEAKAKGQPIDPDDPQTQHIVTHTSLLRVINDLRPKLKLSERLTMPQSVYDETGTGSKKLVSHICKCELTSEELGTHIEAYGEVNEKTLETDIARNYSMTIMANRAQDRAYLALLALNYDHALYGESELSRKPNNTNAQAVPEKSSAAVTPPAKKMVETSSKPATLTPAFVKVSEKLPEQPAPVSSSRGFVETDLNALVGDPADEQEFKVIDPDGASIEEEVVYRITDTIIDENALLVEPFDPADLVEEELVVEDEPDETEGLEDGSSEAICRYMEATYAPESIEASMNMYVHRADRGFAGVSVRQSIEMLANGSEKAREEFNHYLNKKMVKDANIAIREVIKTILARNGLLRENVDGTFYVVAGEGGEQHG